MHQELGDACGILCVEVVHAGIAGLAGLACSLNHTDEAA